ncbi:baseplate J/gp47 family protein [Undibacterium danionis]|uniref:Baseplate J/gp47 family protein n=1 Tax=Undibacterium danionis TaxID=1812100 RepID=A0ABV6IK22_9BURK
MSIDLSKLPAPTVIEELSFDSLVDAHKQELLQRQPNLANVINLVSEPLVKQLEVFAYREMLLRQRINQAARSNLLAYATGTDLDHKGAFYDLARLADESDDRYRQRIQYRIASLAGNGTAEQYKLIAMTASSNVRDSNVYLFAPGVVGLILWLSDQSQVEATESLVTAAMNEPNAKPVGISILISTAKLKAIDFTATVYREPAAPVDLSVQVHRIFIERLASYAKLGKNIPLSWITSVLHQPYISRVEYGDSQPDLYQIAFDEYAMPGQINIIDGGVQ